LVLCDNDCARALVAVCGEKWRQARLGPNGYLKKDRVLTDGGLTWSEVNLGSAQPPASITSSACAAEQMCFAVGGQVTELPGKYAVSILMSTNDGTDWSVLQVPPDGSL
jgi:hypothetical protein